MPKKNSFPYRGYWTANDPWETEVAFTINKRGTKVTVRATDKSDGEQAEVYGLKLKRDGLYFAAYWSSGQFTKYRLRPTGEGEIEAVFTYTGTTQFGRRKKAKS